MGKSLRDGLSGCRELFGRVSGLVMYRAEGEGWICWEKGVG